MPEGNLLGGLVGVAVGILGGGGGDSGPRPVRGELLIPPAPAQGDRHLPGSVSGLDPIVAPVAGRLPVRTSPPDAIPPGSIAQAAPLPLGIRSLALTSDSDLDDDDFLQAFVGTIPFGQQIIARLFGRGGTFKAKPAKAPPRQPRDIGVPMVPILPKSVGDFIEDWLRRNVSDRVGPYVPQVPVSNPRRKLMRVEDMPAPPWVGPLLPDDDLAEPLEVPRPEPQPQPAPLEVPSPAAPRIVIGPPLPEVATPTVPARAPSPPRAPAPARAPIRVPAGNPALPARTSVLSNPLISILTGFIGRTAPSRIGDPIRVPIGDPIATRTPTFPPVPQLPGVGLPAEVQPQTLALTQVGRRTQREQCEDYCKEKKKRKKKCVHRERVYVAAHYRNKCKVEL